jgi:hypothetical protein
LLSLCLLNEFDHVMDDLSALMPSADVDELSREGALPPHVEFAVWVLAVGHC